MSSEDPDSVSFQNVPDLQHQFVFLEPKRRTYVAVEIVVSGKEKTTGCREGNGRYSAENGVGLELATYGDTVYLVIVQLAIRADVVQLARCIVRTRSKRISIGEVSTHQSSETKKVIDQERGPYCTALISSLCPTKVWTHFAIRISHTLAIQSHAPLTNKLGFAGLILKLITSPK
jgi:hypothetical protein